MIADLLFVFYIQFVMCLRIDTFWNECIDLAPNDILRWTRINLTLGHNQPKAIFSIIQLCFICEICVCGYGFCALLEQWWEERNENKGFKCRECIVLLIRRFILDLHCIINAHLVFVGFWGLFARRNSTKQPIKPSQYRERYYKTERIWWKISFETF